MAATFAREGRFFEALRALGHERDLAAASSLLGGLSGESTSWYGSACAVQLAAAVLALALAMVVGVLDCAHLAASGRARWTESYGPALAALSGVAPPGG